VWDFRNPPHVGPSVAIPGQKQPLVVPPGKSVFRASRYAPSYPGLAGKELTPGKTVEEIEGKREKPSGPS